MSAGLKQARVIVLPPLIARIFDAPSSSSSFETAHGNHPSAIRATRLREGSVIPPTQIGGPPRRAGFGSNNISRKLVYRPQNEDGPLRAPQAPQDADPFI